MLRCLLATYQGHLRRGCNSHAQSSEKSRIISVNRAIHIQREKRPAIPRHKDERSFCLHFDFVSLKDSKNLTQKHFFKRWEFVLDSNPALTFMQQHGNEYILLLLSDIFGFTTYYPYFAISKYVKRSICHKKKPQQNTKKPIPQPKTN